MSRIFKHIFRSRGNETLNLGSATVSVAAFGVSPNALFRPVAFLSRFTRHLSLFVRTFACFCGVSPRCSNKRSNSMLPVLTRFNAILHLASSHKSNLFPNFLNFTAEFKNRNVARKQKVNPFEPFLHPATQREAIRSAVNLRLCPSHPQIKHCVHNQNDPTSSQQGLTR